ncbi:MAG: aminoacyl-tRNA hydrolase [Roseiflexus sp.]|nr:aminoacyl-tRNA hydrolase [Roseiflexus sp.]MCS7290884.1 aminoacyl-tRNA hydrolase [Roseiflexus sp.]MDW8146289.1 aminoacyl-tRNA hydrolase [Roseiflexaceae bacterium]MDW8232736.1 aminoacyl-tRNA hydrolase [Roseiflexaceae bacterium]
MWLIVGLGNPGETYARTRHNIGFRVVTELADRHCLKFTHQRANAQVAEGIIAGQRVALALPQTYMNLSGQAVVGLRQWYKIDPATELLVVYDDVDLPFGVLRLRERGSAGTHNGMRSIVTLLGSQVFPRLRIGINRPPAAWDLADYVLARFSPEEEAQLPDVIRRAVDALELVLREGVTVAMNRVNAPSPKPEAQDQKQALDDSEPSGAVGDGGEGGAR